MNHFYHDLKHDTHLLRKFLSLFHLTWSNLICHWCFDPHNYGESLLGSMAQQIWRIMSSSLFSSKVKSSWQLSSRERPLLALSLLYPSPVMCAASPSPEGTWKLGYIQITLLLTDHWICRDWHFRIIANWLQIYIVFSCEEAAQKVQMSKCQCRLQNWISLFPFLMSSFKFSKLIMEAVSNIYLLCKLVHSAYRTKFKWLHCVH